MSVMKFILTRAVFLVLLIATLGCEVESKYPLSDEKTSKPDAKLLGDWRWEDEPEPWRIAKHPKLEKALQIEMNVGGETGKAVLFTTQIKGKRFLTFQEKNEVTGKVPNLIYYYEMPDDNTIRVYFMSEEAISRAIVEKRLSGEAKIVTRWKKRLFRRPIMVQDQEAFITARPDELREFFKTRGNSCFSKDKDKDIILRFKRVKPSEKNEETKAAS